jgi:hypothetical protein
MDNVPSEVGSDAIREARAQITRIVNAALALTDYFSDTSRLLKEAQGVVVESQRLLWLFFQELSQSPGGGIRMLRELSRQYAPACQRFSIRARRPSAMSWRP